jgi:hypothetical protein
MLMALWECQIIRKISVVKRLYPLVFFITLCVIGAKSQSICPDGLGGFWTIDGFAVEKIDGNGNRIATFTNQILGKPYSIDPSDPFRVMVFFQNTQNVVFLDNNASQIGKHVYLGNLGLGEVTLACRSARGGIWLYHREGWEMVRTNPQISRIEQRIALPASLNQSQPNFMLEYQKVLYVGVNNKLIIPFDLYGFSSHPIDIQYNFEFGFYQNNLLTVSSDTIIRISLVDKKIREKHYCPCGSFPLIINGTPHCFDGKTFLPCKKID